MFAARLAGAARRRLRLLARRRQAARRPVLALAARRACAAARACSTRARSSGPPSRSSCRSSELVIYELHVGTFTPEGTFDAAAGAAARARRARRDRGRADAGRDVPGRARLGLRRRAHLRAAPRLRRAAGARALRRRGARGRARGDPRRRLQPHRPGLGAARARSGPYFTDRHDTFWGDAIDYARRGVREWAIQNAELWVRDYRIDGLRLDAVARDLRREPSRT